MYVVLALFVLRMSAEFFEAFLLIFLIMQMAYL